MWTRRATASILLTAGIYLAASYTGLGWLYAIDALIISLIVISFLHAGWNLRNLDVKRKINTTAYEGETVSTNIVISNSGKSPRLLIEIQDSFPHASKPSIILAEFLPGKKSLSRSYTAQCPRRGKYRLDKLKFRSGGAFGLFIRSRTFALDDELLIYPSASPIAQFPAEATSLSASHQFDSPGTEASFLWTREFRSGDPRRYIHWRSTARRGQLIVKQLAEERSKRLVLLLHSERGSDVGEVGESSLDYAVRAAASIACYALERRYGLDIILPGKDGNGVEHHRPVDRWQALETLAGVQAGDTQSFEESLSELAALKQELGGARIVALLPNPLPEHAAALAGLGGAASPIAVIADVASFDSDAGATPSPIPAFKQAGLPTYILEQGKTITQCLAQPV